MTVHSTNKGPGNKGSRSKRWGAVTGRPGHQKGAVTMFSAVLILILLTEMLIYAVQVGVFEQRKSGNEMRQKQAFHAAETGIQQAHAYLLSNVLDLTSSGTDGWLSDTFAPSGGSGRWVSCAGAYSSDDKTHPCYGEPLGSGAAVNLRDSSYFYSLDGANPAEIPMLADQILPEETETATASSAQAILCLLDIDRTPGSVPVKGCLAKDDPNVNNIYFIITLLSRGQAECDAAGLCAAEALVAQKLGSFGPLTGAGGPGVPLTSRSSFPPGGTAEIVPNPNGAGTGVPVSSWLNNNTKTDPDTGRVCGDGIDPLNPIGGSWTTCERHEWYGVSEMPDEFSPNGQYTCPTATCSCGSDERRISYAEAGGDVAGIDIIIDDNFPCDLFEYTFNEPRANYQAVKDTFAPQVITDCTTLGPDSSGSIWVDGSVDTCKIAANTSVGSPEKPVFLVSGANLFSLSGGAKIYGVLFITDVDGRKGEFEATGTNTVYGAVIVDGPLGKFSGTYQIVYNDDLIDRATKTGSLGKIYGGWTDFHQDWR